jgi:hypothetical protein
MTAQKDRKMGLLIKRAIVIVGILLIGFYAYHYMQNNRSVDSVPVADVKASYERGVDWALAHREELFNDHNTMLWWMLQQTAEVTGDIRLKLMVRDYIQHYQTLFPGNPWLALFDPMRYRGMQLDALQLTQFPDYNQYFLYALACSKDLGETDLIQRQHDTDFCWTEHPAGSACITHQMMGFRFLQRSQCDLLPDVDQRIATLQNVIRNQLQFDPRVVDVYLQRILMLLDSGAVDSIKPIWVQRAIAAQLPDGTWSNLQPLLPVGGGRYFGFNQIGFGVEPLIGNFHATAQGIFVMGLLQQPQYRAALGLDKTSPQ